MRLLGMKMDDVILFFKNETLERKNRPQIELIQHPEGVGFDPRLPDLTKQSPIGMAKKMILMTPMGEMLDETLDLGLPTTP